MQFTKGFYIKLLGSRYIRLTRDQNEFECILKEINAVNRIDATSLHDPDLALFTKSIQVNGLSHIKLPSRVSWDYSILKRVEKLEGIEIDFLYAAMTDIVMRYTCDIIFVILFQIISVKNT